MTLPRDLGSQYHLFPLVHFNNKTKLPVSPLYTHLVPQLLQLPSEGHVSNHLSHLASGFCIHKFHRTIANKEAVKQLTGMEVLAVSSPQGSKWREPIDQFCLEVFDCISHRLLAEDLTSNYHTSRRWLWSSPELEIAGGHFHCLLFLCWSNNKTNLAVSPRKELVHKSISPAFMAATWGISPYHLAVITSGTCIHKSLNYSKQGNSF